MNKWRKKLKKEIHKVTKKKLRRRHTEGSKKDVMIKEGSKIHEAFSACFSSRSFQKQ
jgi:hypothetical protein